MGMFAFKTIDTEKTFVLPEFHNKLGNVKTCVKALLITPKLEFLGYYDGYGSMFNESGEKYSIFALIQASSLEDAKENHDLYFEQYFNNFKENNQKIILVENYRILNTEFKTFDEYKTFLLGLNKYSHSCESQGFMGL